MDRTQRDSAEALRTSEERLRQAVRVAGVGIFDHDHLTDVIYWSPQQREIHGWSPDEAITLRQFLEQTVHPEDRKRLEREVGRAHDPRNDGYWDLEYRVVRRDGAVRWIRARSRTFFSGSGPSRRPVRTIGAIRDITEQKEADAERTRLQARLVQAQKMESVGRLAGGVAHDFNNMLGVILGHAEMVRARLDPHSPHYGDILEIESAARRSADLTRQLVGFARKQTIAPRVLDFNATLEGMLSMVQRLIGEDIDVAWCPAEPLGAVKIDPAQVDQILVNLMVNARDAITGHGKVTIETGNIRFDADYCAAHPGSVPGDYIMLAVSDDGCGMEPEMLEHAFEPFFTTKELGQGTGLGLATVYGIVKQNHGFIDVYSEPGSGTTFKIYLRRCEGPVLPSDVEEPSEEQLRGTETVLLVEDEPMVLAVCEALLDGLGYRVLTARTPGEALRQAEEATPAIDVLVTDVVMPEMTGRELALRLTAQMPNLAVVYASGYTANVIAHQGVLEQGVHFLPKPYRRSTLAMKIREALGGH